MNQMAKIDIKCPYCRETKIIKYGKSTKGAQRYFCQNQNCPTTTFILEYTYTGCEPGTDAKIIKMAANASGIQDTARVLGISTQKVMNTLKKQKKRSVKSTSTTWQTMIGFTKFNPMSYYMNR